MTPSCGTSELELEIETLRQELAERDAKLAKLESQIRASQEVMQQFAHIYPDGFPGDWKPQPQHLASQVVDKQKEGK